MKKIGIILALLATLLVGTQCGTTVWSGQPIGGQVLNNYYVNNRINFDNYVNNLKIIDMQSFNHYFGEAAVMGTNGRPTMVDMHHNFIIGVCLQPTDMNTRLEFVSLKEYEGRLYFTYLMQQYERMSYTVQPFTAVLVPRQYINYPIVYQRVTEGELLNYQRTHQDENVIVKPRRF